MDNFYKVLHFIVCMVIVLTADALGLPLWAGVLIACVAAVGKEVYDLQNPDKHTADWADLGADALGILVAMGIILAA